MPQQEQTNQNQPQQKGPQATQQAGVKPGFEGVKSDDQKKSAIDSRETSFDKKESSDSRQANASDLQKSDSASMDRKDQSRTNQ